MFGLRNASVGIATVTQESFESHYDVARTPFGARTPFAMTAPWAITLKGHRLPSPIGYNS